MGIPFDMRKHYDFSKATPNPYATEYWKGTKPAPSRNRKRPVERLTRRSCSGLR